MTAIQGVAGAVTPATRDRTRAATAHRRYQGFALAVDAIAAGAPGWLFATTLHPGLGIGHAAGAVVAAGLLSGGWVGALAVRGAYGIGALGRPHLLGVVLRPWLTFAGLLATLVVLTGLPVDAARFAAAVAVPLLASTGWRLVVRGRLLARHRQALSLARVLVVGEAREVDETVGYLASRTSHEYVPVGACTVGDALVSEAIAVVGRVRPAGEIVDPDGEDGVLDREAVLRAAAAVEADAVMVLPGAGLTNARLRRLVWALHEADLDVIQVPGIVEVEEHRIDLRYVDGLTLLELRRPSRGWPVVLKGLADRALGAALLVALAPVLLVTAAAVRLDSRGPVFYKHTRMGRDAQPFTMWKFRSMVVDADQRKHELLEENQNDGLMFKMQRDPRITRVGRVLRRYSLDELPQLLNVVRGSMSLVGPRPPLPDEVAAYTDVEVRRLGVKPGMTGLWQVSGRSDLTWDETVTLDLRYVDNWTPKGDLRLLARTAQAVLGGRGAY